MALTFDVRRSLLRERDVGTARREDEEGDASSFTPCRLEEAFEHIAKQLRSLAAPLPEPKPSIQTVTFRARGLSLNPQKLSNALSLSCGLGIAIRMFVDTVDLECNALGDAGLIVLHEGLLRTGPSATGTSSAPPRCARLFLASNGITSRGLQSWLKSGLVDSDFFRQVVHIGLTNNRLGDDGLSCLEGAILDMPHLRTLHLTRIVLFTDSKSSSIPQVTGPCPLGAEAVRRFAATAQRHLSLTQIFFKQNGWVRVETRLVELGVTRSQTPATLEGSKFIC